MTNETPSAIDLVERVRRLSAGATMMMGKTERDKIVADVAEQSDTIARLQAALDDMRQQGQAEGFAAAVQWLRDRSACKPRAPLWSAASELADAMEQSRRPGSSVGGE